MGKIFRAAMYTRLSREDGDNVESESIVNQKKFIIEHVKKINDIFISDEYNDDGFSGGNFNRPGDDRLSVNTFLRGELFIQTISVLRIWIDPRITGAFVIAVIFPVVFNVYSA